MHPISIILGLSNTLVGLMLIAICWPMLKGRVKPNRHYGFRFPGSFSSDEAWYAVNYYGARRMIGWSGVLVLFGLATLFAPLDRNLYAIIATANAPLIVLIPAVEAWRFSKRFQAQP